MTETMAEKIALSKSNNVHSKLLLTEVRKIWDEWDIQECIGNSLSEAFLTKVQNYIIKKWEGNPTTVHVTKTLDSI